MSTLNAFLRDLMGSFSRTKRNDVNNKRRAKFDESIYSVLLTTLYSNLGIIIKFLINGCVEYHIA